MTLDIKKATASGTAANLLLAHYNFLLIRIDQ